MPPRKCCVAAALCAASLVVAVPAAAASEPRFSVALELEVGLSPLTVVAADLNGDGNADLATADAGSGSASILFGKGTGNFRKRVAHRTARSPYAIAADDIDRDGDPDLVTASSDRAGSVSVLVNEGAGRFRRGGIYGSGSPDAYAVAAGDLNRDGILDLVTAHDTRDHLTVLVGRPGAHFRHSGSYRGPRATDVVLADLNRDGALDAALACRDGSLVVRLGLGDGTFGPAQAYVSGPGAFGVGVADLDRDDKLDIAVANWRGSSLSVFRGVGDGTVAAGTRYSMGARGLRWVDAVMVADFDRDGNLDVATPGHGASVRRGLGDSTLADRQAVSEEPSFPTQSGAVADFDGDGWPDLAVAEACAGELCIELEPSAVYVYLNWTGQSAPACVVPPVAIYQLRFRVARRSLHRAGCAIGKKLYRHSRSIAKGRVIAQRPRYGVVLPSFGRVDLVLSRGRRR